MLKINYLLIRVKKQTKKMSLSHANKAKYVSQLIKIFLGAKILLLLGNFGP